MSPSRSAAVALVCSALALALGAPACGRSTVVTLDAPVPIADGGVRPRDAAPAPDGGALVAAFVAQGCERLEVRPLAGDGGLLDGGLLDAALADAALADGGLADGGLADGATSGADDGGLLDAAVAEGGDGGAPAVATVCVGHAPLTLTFVPVTSGAVDSWVWTFGETGETPLRAPTPTHTFTLPGSFDVTLTVGGPAGTLAVHPPLPFVEVLPNPVGAPCDVTAQCAAGYECSCAYAGPFDTDCPAAFGGRGLCTRSCAKDADCGAGAICVDLGRGAAFRPRLCLQPCAASDECAAGLTCRDLAAAVPPGSWTRACFVDFLGDVGAPCRDADGQPVHSACVGGLCLELGAAGYCSAPCEGDSCPTGSACAQLGGSGGHPVCLADCSSVACSGDPLLGCEAPDPTGGLGFEVVAENPPAGATYCAPRRCVAAADCQGLPCVEVDGASFCQPAP
jgi:hypothetical protein